MTLVGRDLVKAYVIERSIFGRPRAVRKAVDDVSLVVEPGRTFALVGESGSGKTTTAELMLGLNRPDAGSVTVDGADLGSFSGRQLREVRRNVQVVFQDPASALDPTQRVGSALSEPLAIHRSGARSSRRQTVLETLDLVGLPLQPRDLDRYPAEFSGGQRQRLAIARALVLRPRYLVLDEPVSALDVSTQARVLTTLRDLQAETGVGYLLISHDLSVVRQVADDVAVMYRGKVVEQGSANDVLGSPRHPYTHALLDAVPRLSARSRQPTFSGDVVESPDATQSSEGCAYRPRCPLSTDRCAHEVPELRVVGDAAVACHNVLNAVPVASPTMRGDL
ncbi:MAG: ATP-binding cassette domain-containing protein [Actinomycetota bacterium]|nr:ATP-binding cassette domain-containing protein [Actinomycetota bacterium]